MYKCNRKPPMNACSHIRQMTLRSVYVVERIAAKTNERNNRNGICLHSNLNRTVVRLFFAQGFVFGLNFLVNNHIKAFQIQAEINASIFVLLCRK